MLARVSLLIHMLLKTEICEGWKKWSSLPRALKKDRSGGVKSILLYKDVELRRLF